MRQICKLDSTYFSNKDWVIFLKLFETTLKKIESETIHFRMIELPDANRYRIAWYGATIFLSSAILLVIEITAGEFNSWRVVTDVAAAVDAILRGDKYDYQHRIRRPDGDLRLVLGRG